MNLDGKKTVVLGEKQKMKKETDYLMSIAKRKRKKAITLGRQLNGMLPKRKLKLQLQRTTTTTVTIKSIIHERNELCC